MTFTGSSPAGPTRRRAAWWWVAGGTFVVGLLVGVLVAGLLIRNAPEPGSSAGGKPSAGSDPTQTSAARTSGSGATVEILVNEACLRALNAAQDAYGAIERVGGAIADLDFAELDAIVRQLQPLQVALRDDVSACQVSTRLPDGSLVSSSVQRTASDGTSEPDVTVTATPTR